MLRASRAESLLTIAAVAIAAAMVVRSRSIATGVRAALLLFEAFVYSNAPWRRPGLQDRTAPPSHAVGQPIAGPRGIPVAIAECVGATFAHAVGVTHGVAGTISNPFADCWSHTHTDTNPHIIPSAVTSQSHG